jgi:hypothetical protein
MLTYIIALAIIAAFLLFCMKLSLSLRGENAAYRRPQTSPDAALHDMIFQRS